MPQEIEFERATKAETALASGIGVALLLGGFCGPAGPQAQGKIHGIGEQVAVLEGRWAVTQRAEARWAVRC